MISDVIYLLTLDASKNEYLYTLMLFQTVDGIKRNKIP